MVHNVESKVLHEEYLTPTVKHIRLSVPDHFEFTPGQFICVNVPTEKNPLKRAYCITSVPQEKGFIELCIKEVEGGKGTTFLFGLKEGDKVDITGPMGNFIVPKDAQDLFFIATGAGYAPFRCMIKHILHQGHKHRVTLLTGYRYEEEELYIHEKNELKEKYPNFSFHNIVSRPKDPNYNGEIGRIQKLIDKHVPSNFDGHFFLCGLTPMILETKKLLMEKGYPEDKIQVRGNSITR